MLDPAAFERSVETYLDSLTAEDLRSAVLRSIKRMDGAHRSQLALFLGHDVGGDPIDEVGGSSVQEHELRQFIESCGLLRERFTAFLRENPRAVFALGNAASSQIFGVPNAGQVDGEAREPARKLPLQTVAIAAFAVALAVLPLIAQYAHQRGMIAGLDQLSMAPVTFPSPVRSEPVHRAAQRQPQHQARAHVAKVRKAPVVHHAASVAVSRRPVHRRPRAVAFRNAPRSSRVAYVRNWKFDPQYNPYLNHRHWRPLPIAANLPPAGRDFASRAQLLVTSYLHDVVSGNTALALHHLGLPSGADAANLRELPIITRDSRVHVVAVQPQSDGGAKVEVDISGRSGEYFEVFYVARDGPAARSSAVRSTGM
jgi:hypothetical protein